MRVMTEIEVASFVKLTKWSAKMKDKIFYAIAGLICGLLIGVPFGAWSIVIEIEKAF